MILENSFFRLLSLALGATVSASTLVLSTYMWGFGLGAWFFGNRVKRGDIPRYLSIIFFTISLLIFLSYPFTVRFLPFFGAFLMESGLEQWVEILILQFISLIALFVPVFLMGGIFPLIADYAIGDNMENGQYLGQIYAVEALGSALGGLFAGFLLIRFFGQLNTLIIAATINIFLAWLAGKLEKKGESGGSAKLEEKKGESGESAKLEENNRKSGGPAKLEEKKGESGGSAKLEEKDEKSIESAKLEENNKKSAALSKLEIKKEKSPYFDKLSPVFIAFALGFAFTGLQIAWFRVFQVYMTNSNYSFALITGISILGLFFGGFIYSMLIKRRPLPTLSALSLSKLMFMASILVFLGFIILVNLPRWIMFPIAGSADSIFLRILAIPAISSLLIIFPATLLSGFIFPYACYLYSGGLFGAGKTVGQMVFANSLGGLLGPLFITFFMLPHKGAALSIIFISLFLFAGGFIVAKIANFPWKMVAIILLFTAFSQLPQVEILPPSFTRFERKILEYHESVEGTWIIGQEKDEGALAAYVNNSSVIGSSYDAIKVVKMVGHLPFLAGLNCEKVMIVGFGIGVTTSAIASHPEVKSITCAELVPGLVNGAHYFSPLNNNIQDDKRLRVIKGDGRHYIATSPEKYDLISCDPTHPILGSGALYTQDYFKLCRDKLNPGGMVSQYLPLHKLLLKDLLSIIKSFASVFPGATVWLGQNHGLLLGSASKLNIDFQGWCERAQNIEDPFLYSEPWHLASCLILDNQAISELTEDIPFNTDNRPQTEFASLKSFDDKNLLINLEFLNINRAKIEGVFENIDDPERMEKFRKSNLLMTEGLYYHLQGQNEQFLNRLLRASELNPENQELPALIRFYFGR